MVAKIFTSSKNKEKGKGKEKRVENDRSKKITKQIKTCLDKPKRE